MNPLKILDTGAEIDGVAEELAAAAGLETFAVTQVVATVDGKKAHLDRCCNLTVVLAPNTLQATRYTGRFYILKGFQNIACMLLGTPFIGALNCLMAPRMGRLFWRCPGGERAVAWMPVDTYREAPTALPAMAQEGSLDPEDGGEPLVHMLVASQSSEEPLPPDWQLTAATDHPAAFVEVAGMIKPLVEEYGTTLQNLITQDPHTTAVQAHAAAHQAAGRMLLANAGQVEAAISKQLASKPQEEVRWLAQLIEDGQLRGLGAVSSTDQNGWLQAVGDAISAADLRPDWADMLRQRLDLKGDARWAEVPQGTQERCRQWLTLAVRGKLVQQGLATDRHPAQQPSDTWHSSACASAQAWMATTTSAPVAAVTQLLEWLAQQEQQRREVTQRRLAQKAAELLVQELKEPAEASQRLWGHSEKAPKSLIHTWAVQVVYLLASQISLMAMAVQHPRLLRWVPNSAVFTYVQPDLVGKAEWANPYAYLPDTTRTVQREHRSNVAGTGGWRNKLLGMARVSPGGPSQYLGIADRVLRGGDYAPPRTYSSDAIKPCLSKFLLPGVLWSSNKFFQEVDPKPSNQEGTSAGAGTGGGSGDARQLATA